jgi:putative phosphoesterase
MRIGLISDTHGLLRPEALAALQGSDAIVHAGDIGGPQILEQLQAIAPVTAVRGNNDTQPWAQALPEVAVLDLGSGASLLVLHDLHDLQLDPAAAGHRVVVSGHSHKPTVQRREGVWYVNPGSAGPRRFSLPVSVAELRVDRFGVRPRAIELSVPAARHR